MHFLHDDDGGHGSPRSQAHWCLHARQRNTQHCCYCCSANSLSDIHQCRDGGDARLSGFMQIPS
ncbi:hypothetical protein PAMP_007492 [Pampus punctatissimus]